MTTTDRRKLTLTIAPELDDRLKHAAACKGVPVERYCVDAIESELAQEGETKPEGKPMGKRSTSDVIAWRKRTFGDRVFARNSVDYIREAREIRNVQMDSWRKPTL